MRRQKRAIAAQKECFNPRICKRCDVRFFSQCRQDLVSIHASVKDATHADDVPDPDKNVSIHASVKDATDHIGYQPIYIKVSIHASVKDATYETKSINEAGHVSIHASVKDATCSSCF